MTIQQAVGYHPNRRIVFKEFMHERIFDASTDEELAYSCLAVLRERFANPAWNYKPKNNSLSAEEEEFLEFYTSEGQYLPSLLRKYADRLKHQIDSRAEHDSDPDWTWYRTVEELLALPDEEAAGYKLPFKGRMIPTAYYLLLQRETFPNEGFVLLS